jgi:hypothetical protein
MNTACPPIPSLYELVNPNNFIEVNINELVDGETVILYDPEIPDQNYRIMCVETLPNKPEHSTHDSISYRYLSGAYPSKMNTSTTFYRRWNRQKRYFRVNHRKDFDDITKKMRVRIRNYPENQNSTSVAEKIMANKFLTDYIANFVGPRSTGKGGRRKTRSKKNKRKSTRRIRRKYQR